MRLALYEPDIAQNTGTLLRLAACLGLGVDVIEPCGFIFGDTRMRRAGMDYMSHVDLVRYRSWTAYREAKVPGRLVLLTTKAVTTHIEARFEPGDTLLLGRESAGVPAHVHDAADLAVRIPLRPGMRSLNVALAGAMVLAEALRQTGLYPDGGADAATTEFAKEIG
ncbi:MAG TPA: tRNA (cytidine(34)-2'-O)-methyltransferase [Stellaceae bacterium]|nr:tRNA (cytidine(34)-2'-O)-methyltransferase [Stellaceae bacterium]